MTIRYAVLDPSEIFNLTSPRYLPEVSRHFAGKRGWHSEHYEPLRDMMERGYIAGFNAASGHYDHLLTSIKREGFRNPIMVTVGGLFYRDDGEIPPNINRCGLPVIEYLGGSRFWAAEQLEVKVPCIVSDLADQMPDAEVLDGVDAVLARFTDKPELVQMRGGGILINNLPFAHLPQPYSMGEQIRMRRKIVDVIQNSVRDWLAEND